jgi:polyribonucleotide nucleotidyltransferase
MNKIDIDVARNCEQYKFDYVAKQAHGSAWVQEGDTVILATVAVDDTVDSKEDFLPLTVQYIEKQYAAGRIPSGFIKRETKPSDFETLTSRIIDRSLRPLFPKGFHFPVQITVLVLSVDAKSDLQRLALNAASAALFTSSLPVQTSVCGARMTKVNNELIVNPTMDELAVGEFDLYLAGSSEDLLMIEMRSLGGSVSESIELPLIDPMLDPALALQSIERQVDNVLSESELIEAIMHLQSEIFAFNKTYTESFTPFVKEGLNLTLRVDDTNESLLTYISDNYTKEIEDALALLAKSERAMILHQITKNIMATDFCIEHECSEPEVSKIVNRLKREKVRAQIINDGVRADGRKLTEVRPISIETNVLPQAHASTLFTRGQTQALTALTLGGSHDSQMFQNLTDSETQNEKLMIHYNFPGFSVGEASRIGPAGRRELGHGNLAKRAIEPTFENIDNKTVRIVSEVLESNGSSSMATVCASSLSLRAAGLDVTNLVAGVAMGMVSEEGKHAILTDINGLEDHDGDMDFKIAGTREGISAMQMDIKLGGISLDVLTEALMHAKDGRDHILSIMEDASSDIEFNEGVLPSTQQFVVDPSKVADIIGQAGKTIRDLIERFDVTIDLDRTKGSVKISGTSQENIESAKDEIRTITTAVKKEYVVGDEVVAKVKKLVDFGAFMELDRSNDGLLHISKISDERISHPSEVLKEGEEIKVRVSGFKGKKIELEKV